MRGRKPASPELKILRGDRPSRRNDRAPVPRDGAPRPPRSLAPAQRRIFRQVVAELDAMHVHCRPDALIIETLAGMVDWNRRAGAQLESSGAWGRGAQGGDVTSPAWRVYRDSTREVGRICAELGLTPAARNRVMVRGPAVDPDIENLLS